MLMGYGARDVVLMGDSAGGNLALVLTLLLRDAHRQLPRRLVLFSPGRYDPERRILRALRCF